MLSNAPYHASPLRRNKEKMVVSPRDSVDGFKGRAARLAVAKGIGGKWSHQGGGYVMSKTAFAKFESMFDAGYDGCNWTRKAYLPEVAA